MNEPTAVDIELSHVWELMHEHEEALSNLFSRIDRRDPIKSAYRLGFKQGLAAGLSAARDIIELETIRLMAATLTDAPAATPRPNFEGHKTPDAQHEAEHNHATKADIRGA